VANNLKIRISGKLRLSVIVISIAFAAATITGLPNAGAAIVSGTMSYQDGKAAAKRQLHYENRITGDIYVAPTEPDGSFRADLPPGLYDLRAERGVILHYKIRVDNADLNVGHVVEPAPLDYHRPFQREAVADAIVENPAPSTANLGGRPLMAMRYGHEAVAPFSAPGTPAPQSTPLGEATPEAASSPAAMMMH
jgi:hypothetical protein